MRLSRGISRLRRLAGERRGSLKLRGQYFIGVEEQDPVGGAKVEGNILLLAVAAKDVIAGPGTEGFSDFDGPVFGTGIDHDDFVGPLDTLERARQVGLLVHGNHGHG